MLACSVQGTCQSSRQSRPLPVWATEQGFDKSFLGRIQDRQVWLQVSPAAQQVLVACGLIGPAACVGRRFRPAKQPSSEGGAPGGLGLVPWPLPWSFLWSLFLLVEAYHSRMQSRMRRVRMSSVRSAVECSRLTTACNGQEYIFTPSLPI